MAWIPSDIVVVSVMPCTAKKFEIGRDDQDAAERTRRGRGHHHP